MECLGITKNPGSSGSQIRYRIVMVITIIMVTDVFIGMIMISDNKGFSSFF